jgi:hypothetical protein
METEGITTLMEAEAVTVLMEARVEALVKVRVVVVLEVVD